jgi:two-component system chemotaxis response regulator CheB
MARVRVLLVDDSQAFRQALALALGSDPTIEVVGQAADGRAAVALAQKLHPDVITMDVVMPVMDGLEASKLILADHPVPIILMSTLARSDEQRMALNALRLGVVDVTNKPVLAGPRARDGIAAVTKLVKAAAEVDVKRRPRSGPVPSGQQPGVRRPELIAIAASTGGPPALERILGPLPLRCPPVVVAQHLAPSFARGFADWLSSAIRRPVVPVEISEPLKEGTVYIAAEGKHIRVRRGWADAVRAEPSELSPNADVLFRAAAAYYGDAALGLVLTGMGNDGAEGLLAMRKAGAWTVGQDRDSSVVYGMPRVAAEAGACVEVLPLDEIAQRLLALLSGKGGR